MKILSFNFEFSSIDPTLGTIPLSCIYITELSHCLKYCSRHFSVSIIRLDGYRMNKGCETRRLNFMNQKRRKKLAKRGKSFHLWTRRHHNFSSKSENNRKQYGCLKSELKKLLSQEQSIGNLVSLDFLLRLNLVQWVRADPIGYQ